MLLWQYERVMRGDLSQEFVSSSTEENPAGQQEVANEVQGLSPPALETLWVKQCPGSWMSGFPVLAGRTTHLKIQHTDVPHGIPNVGSQRERPPQYLLPHTSPSLLPP